MTHRIRIETFLQDGDDFLGREETLHNMNKIVEFYEKQLPFLSQSYPFELIGVYVPDWKKREVEIEIETEQTGEELDLLEQMIENPDDDGNNPIDITEISTGGKVKTLEKPISVLVLGKRLPRESTSMNVLLCFEDSFTKGTERIASLLQSSYFIRVDPSQPGWAEEIGDYDHVYVMETSLIKLLLEDGIAPENIHVLEEKPSSYGLKVENIDIPKDLTKILKPELQQLAKDLGIKGYSKLNKSDLIAILEKTIVL